MEGILEDGAQQVAVLERARNVRVPLLDLDTDIAFFGLRRLACDAVAGEGASEGDGDILAALLQVVALHALVVEEAGDGGRERQLVAALREGVAGCGGAVVVAGCVVCG